MCVKYALGILLALNNNSELKAITVRLMYKLWLFQPRVYPQLYKILQDRSLSLNAKALEELRVSKAVTIRDICRERYTAYNFVFRFLKAPIYVIVITHHLKAIHYSASQ